jgi:hypothetical protein
LCAFRRHFARPGFVFFALHLASAAARRPVRFTAAGGAGGMVETGAVASAVDAGGGGSISRFSAQASRVKPTTAESSSVT